MPRLLCALRRCLQDGSAGQLGPNAAYNETTPVAVSSSLQFSAIAAGSGHTCALAVDGALYCWGAAPANGLEDTTGSTKTPTEAGSGRKFVAVSAGYALTCVLDAAGDVWCMGECALLGGSLF